MPLWATFVLLFLRGLITAINSPKLYFVKLDVKACFDTIDQTKLLQIMRDALSDVSLTCLNSTPSLDPVLRMNTPLEGSVPSARTLGNTRNAGLRRRFLLVRKMITAIGET